MEDAEVTMRGRGMAYKELFYKATRLIEHHQITIGEYDEMTKPLDREVEQGPKIGHWISHREHCEMNNLRPSGLGSYFWCSKCDCGIDSKNFSRVNYNYCPNCGTKMEESEK